MKNINLKCIKLKLVAALIIISPISSIGQRDSGIKFELNQSWKEICAKAKLENKYIFMDCFTTWCAPCRYMSQNIFPQNSVGNFMNANFISVSVQMDQTSKDPEAIKQWYDDAKKIQDLYTISAYPTFLFFSPDGQVVHRQVGVCSGDDFISIAKNALSIEKQYYTQVNNYKQHKNDSAFLRDALIVAEKQYDNFNAPLIAKYYVDCLKTPFSPNNLQLIIQSTQTSSSEVFQFLLQNVPRIDSSLAVSRVEDNLMRIITEEEITTLFLKEDTVLNWKIISAHLKNKYPSLGDDLIRLAESRFQAEVSASIKKKLFISNAADPNWKKEVKELRLKFPEYDFSKILADIKPQYFAFKKKWSECTKASIKLLDKYGEQLSAGHINNIVYGYLFMHASSPRILRKALKWSRRSVDMQPSMYNQIDTYANLLYKTGNIEEAISWEEKAIEKCKLVNDQMNLKVFQQTLEKIKTGMKTWEE